MKSIWKRLTCFVIMIALLGAFACADHPAQRPETQEPDVSATQEPTPEETPVEEIVAAAEPTPEPTPVLTPEPESTPEPTPEPTATPEPTPMIVTIGAVGDIMIPSMIVADVKETDGTYDFSQLFLPMRELFESVDLMCGNLEAPVAGPEKGYSAGKNESSGLYLFNAPDSVLDTLKEYGVDMLTTANNHCFDKGIQGLRRTVEVVRAAGFYQTGTYLSEEDRLTPCIVEVNGIRIGVVAMTRLINNFDVSREEAYAAFGYMLSHDSTLSQECRDSIARVREAGADYVILFAHWDHENDNPTGKDTKSIARQAIEAGADCIIGSHPHRIKGAEYITVERKDGPYTGLVLYSLGNFTANANFKMMVGLFARITLQKDPETGKVTMTDAGILPTFTIRRAEKMKRFAVVPTYADATLITGLGTPLTKGEIDSIAKAREFAFQRLGTVDGLRVLDDPER